MGLTHSVKTGLAHHNILSKHFDAADKVGLAQCEVLSLPKYKRRKKRGARRTRFPLTFEETSTYSLPLKTILR